MSYLKSVRQAKDGPAGPDGKRNPRYSVTWRSTTGVIEVNERGAPDQVLMFYNRFTDFGRRVGRDAESEKHFIGRYLLITMDLPDTCKIDWHWK